jgi:UDP-N-acetylglucosamine--N-acetylmuramyl-(pentapeptide) pyrophosphoryl-undecaprenol N-acetylglucosamine transferase
VILPEPGVRTVVIAAGGTGGHLFPAEALARALIARGWRIILATDARGGAHAGDFPAEKIITLPAATIRRRDPLSLARAALTILSGVMAGRAALSAANPAVVVGFGGYPSLPALLAALSQGRRTVIHEQNAVFGRANRLLAPFVTQVACAFPALAKAPARIAASKIVTGNPVRPPMAALAGQGYAPPQDEIRLLITGGSQGARLLSELVPVALAALPRALRSRLRVEQQTRPESLEFARQTYLESGVAAEVAPFFRDMAGRLARAHLVIGRAGASTVTELAVAGRPSLLIPLGVALDDDQGQNAAILGAAGAAQVLRERDLTAPALTTLLETLIQDGPRLTHMAAAAAALAHPDGAERLADVVEGVAAPHPVPHPVIPGREANPGPR